MTKWLSVDVEGWKEIQEKLRYGGDLYTPWRSMLRKSVDYVERRAKARAPLGKRNSIAPAIKGELVGRPVPMFGKVSFPNAAGENGFRYAGALEGGEMYHYRHKPGLIDKPTKGWWRGSLTGAKRMLQKYMQDAKREIEQLWQR